MQNQQIILLKALLGEPNKQQKYINYAQFLANNYRHEQAYQQCRKAVQINDQNAEIWCLLGQILAQLQNQSEAIICFNKSLLINPRLTGALIGLARLQTNIEKIEQYATKCLQIDPQSSNSLTLLAYVKSTKQQSNKNEQVQLLEKAVKLNPKNTLALNNIAWIFWQQNKMQQAIKLIRKGLQIDPSNKALNQSIMVFMVQQKKYDECQKYLKKYVKNWRGITTHPFQIYADFLIERNKFKEASQQLQKCVQLKPQKVQFLILLCQTYLAQKQYEKALKIVRKIQEINPKSKQALNMLCQVYEKTNQLGVLKNILILRLQEHYYEQQILRHLTKVCHQREQYQQSEQYMRKLIEISPNNPQFYYDLSIYLFKTNRFTQALNFIDRSISVDSSFWLAYYIKGFIHKQQNNHKQSIINFEKAISLNKLNEHLSYSKIIQIHIQNLQFEKAQILLKTLRSSNKQNISYLVDEILVLFLNENIEQVLQRIADLKLQFQTANLPQKNIIISSQSLFQIKQILNKTQPPTQPQQTTPLTTISQVKQSLLSYLDLDGENQQKQNKNIDLQKIKMAIRFLQQQLLSHKQSQIKLNRRLTVIQDQVSKIKKQFQWDQRVDLLLADCADSELYRCLYWVVTCTVQSYRAAELGILQKGYGVMKSNAGFFIEKMSKLLGLASKISIIGDFCSVFGQIAQFYLEQQKRYVVTQIVQSTNKLFSEKKLSQAVSQSLIFMSASSTFQKWLKCEKQNTQIWYNKLITTVQKTKRKVFQKVTGFTSQDISKQYNLSLIICGEIMMNLIKEQNFQSIKNASNPVLKSIQIWLQIYQQFDVCQSNGENQIRIKVNKAVIFEDKGIIGKMDPYCKVKYGTIKYKSQVHKNGHQNPEWQHPPFIFTIKKNSVQAQFTFKVYNNKMIFKDGLIGICKQIGSIKQLKNKGYSVLSLLSEGKSIGELYVNYS